MKKSSIKKVIDDRVRGKLVACHDALGHHYKFTDTGTVVDSVTTKFNIINKSSLDYWKMKIALEWALKNRIFENITDENKNSYVLGMMKAPNDIRDDAGNIGTYVHDCIDAGIKEWIKTGVKPLDMASNLGISDPRAIAGVRSAQHEIDKCNVIPIDSELIVGWEPYNVGGTLDVLVLNNGKLELWDWKTSNNIGKSFPMQLSLYAKMFELMSGLKIYKRVVKHLSKDYAGCKSYEIIRPGRSYQTALNFCRGYDWWYDERSKFLDNKKIIKL